MWRPLCSLLHNAVSCSVLHKIQEKHFVCFCIVFGMSSAEHCCATVISTVRLALQLLLLNSPILNRHWRLCNTWHCYSLQHTWCHICVHVLKEKMKPRVLSELWLVSCLSMQQLNTFFSSWVVESLKWNEAVPCSRNFYCSNQCCFTIEPASLIVYLLFFTVRVICVPIEESWAESFLVLFYRHSVKCRL